MRTHLRLDPPKTAIRVETTQEPQNDGYLFQDVQRLQFLPPSAKRFSEGGLRSKGLLKQSLPNKPLVSVITVVFNGERHLDEALLSVIRQTYDNIEYIIIDGGSTDRTVEIIRKYEEKIDYWVSEQDEGISDAFNKGISVAHGEYIQLLNADDWLAPDKVEESVVAMEEHPDIGFVFGDLQMVASGDKPSLRICGDVTYRNVICYLMPRLNHPTVLARRSIYEECGLFDKRWRIAMDYDWLLRITLAGVAGKYIPGLTVYMREGGVSRNWRNGVEEVRDVAVHNGGNILIAYGVYLFFCVKITIRIILQLFLPHQWLMIFRPGKTYCNISDQDNK